MNALTLRLSVLAAVLLFPQVQESAFSSTWSQDPRRNTSNSEIQSAPTITKIDVRKAQSWIDIVIASDGQIEKYDARAVGHDRVVVDLLNVKAPDRLQNFQVNHLFLRQVRISRHPAKVRLVLTLDKPATYSIHASQTALAIRLESKKLIMAKESAAITSLQGKNATIPVVNLMPTSNHSNDETGAMPLTQGTAQLLISDPQKRSPDHIADRALRLGEAHTTHRGSEQRERSHRVGDLSSDPIRAQPYIGVYGGFTLPQSFQSVKSIEIQPELKLSNLDLARSGIVGIKLGVFQPSRLKWLGMETEFFYTNPHVKQQDITVTAPGMVATTNFPGSHVRVATWAFNWIFRYPGERFQPYAGAGLGIFWGRVSGGIGSASDTSPGLNALAGTRLLLSKRLLAFGEYKYNRATFDFGGDLSITALYQAHHFVGGLAVQF